MQVRRTEGGWGMTCLGYKAKVKLQKVQISIWALEALQLQSQTWKLFDVCPAVLSARWRKTQRLSKWAAPFPELSQDKSLHRSSHRQTHKTSSFWQVSLPGNWSTAAQALILINPLASQLKH